MQTKLADQPHLDWLRFALASIVVLGHSGAQFFGPIEPGLAVDVFLALSGWLIGGILLRTVPADLPRFFFNRATRIWIPFGCSVVMLYALAALRDGIDANWWKYLFYDVTFMHYNFTVFPQALEEMPLHGTGNHFWSISVEEQFYLVAPFMLSFPALLPRIAAATVFSLLVFFAGPAFLPIAAGTLAALLQYRFGDWHLTPKGRTAVWGVTIAAFFALMFWDNWMLVALFSVGVVLTLATPGRRTRLARFFGAISFPLYLNAWIGVYAAHSIAKRLGTSGGEEILLEYLLAVLAGIVSWYLIDRQVMARRASWYRPSRGKALALAAYSTAFVGLLGGFALR